MTQVKTAQKRLDLSSTFASVTPTFFVALGGNTPSTVGPPAATLAAALRRCGENGLGLRALSYFYRTPSFPKDSGPDFVNAAAAFQSALTPQEVLSVLHKIEAEFGRDRTSRWAPRTLDLDLIAFGDVVAPTLEGFARWRDLPLSDQQKDAPGQLVLPHPRLQDRAFVLVPLADIAADWVHPVSGRSVAEMLEECPMADRAEITVIR